MGKPLKKWIITTRIYRLWHREVDPNPSQQPKKNGLKKREQKDASSYGTSLQNNLGTREQQ